MGSSPSFASPDNQSEITPDCRYRFASPHFLLPMKVSISLLYLSFSAITVVICAQCPTLVVTGDRDFVVPADVVRNFHSLAAAGGDCPVRLLDFADADHFTVVTASSKHWRSIYDAIVEIIPVH